MKAERRHELQQNSLAKFLDNLPVMLRLYADRILLVVVLVLLVIVLIRWRVNAAATRTAQVADNLAAARSSVKQLEHLNLSRPPDQIVSFRNKLIADVNDAIEQIASNASNSDATLQAQALLTRGDLYWTLANSPPIPGAATQPSLTLPKSGEEYLSLAADSYQQVQKNFPDNKEAALAANFGLAAIAENRRNWDEAARIYNQIKDLTTEKMYKDLAEQRLKLLPEIKEPMLVGDLTSKPAELVPATLPSTQPAPAPGSPVTAPATQPSSQAAT
jgi:hypothetical protein